MSSPARELGPGPGRRRGPAPARAPRREAPRGRPRRAGRPAAKPARPEPHHLGFLLFSCGVVGTLVVGLVMLNALLAQSSFRILAAEERLENLADLHVDLTRRAAHLSDPGRIAAWAQRHGMRLPDDIHILHVRADDPAAPAGASDLLDPGGLGLKPIVEGAG